MRLAILTVLLLTVLVPVNRETLAQAPPAPDVTVQHFYAWYLHLLNQNQDPLGKHQAELSKFVTPRLMAALNRALKRPDGIDADFFVDAQDEDPAWEKNISTSAMTVQADRATVNVTLKGGEAFGTKRLKIGLRKQAGGWKIDSVNNRLNP